MPRIPDAGSAHPERTDLVKEAGSAPADGGDAVRVHVHKELAVQRAGAGVTQEARLIDADACWTADQADRLEATAVLVTEARLGCGGWKTMKG